MDFQNLPPVYTRVMPELLQDPSRWQKETRATCEACPMLPQPGEPDPPQRRVFTARHRCCTYTPNLANWQVGRILREGGRGAERVLWRMDDADGVDGYGIMADLFGQRIYHFIRPDQFGAMEMRCPYWVDGALSCSVWSNRNAICRNWYCKSVSGRRGHQVWDATKEICFQIERAVAMWLVDIGPPPAKGFALVNIDDELLPTMDDVIAEKRANYDKAMWIDWFRWCADRLDRLTDEDVAEIRELFDPRAEMIILRTSVANRAAPMPDKPMMSIAHWQTVDGGILIAPWSLFDPILAPPWAFKLFARLDGKTDWREAIAATEAEVGEPVPADLLPALWRAGGLAWPDPRAVDMAPGAHVFPIPMWDP